MSTESDVLRASWSFRNKERLKTYLVEDVRNPQIHLQSVLTRHFLIKKCLGAGFESLMQQELQFAVEMNRELDENRLDEFQRKWQERLSQYNVEPITVVEAACGSANDYRFFVTYGLSRFLNYTGFDIARPNIENALELCPQARFEEADILNLSYETGSFDYLIVHDLFEHLSLGALEIALTEVCRVARRGAVLAFFNMENIAEHFVWPFRKVYWNFLSLEKVEAFLQERGWSVEIIKIDDLAAELGFDDYYNKGAYTFVLSRPNSDHALQVLA